MRSKYKTVNRELTNVRNRQILIVILILALLAGLCACGGSSGAAATEPETTAEPTATEAPAITEAPAPEPTEAPDPMDSGSALDAVFEACPIESYLMKDIRTALQPDKSWLVTFTSDYGDFMYLVDGFTGEILDRDEPDLEAAGPVKTMITAEEALDIAEAASPIRSGLKNIKVSRGSAEGIWVVTFDSDYGAHMYIVDGYTREILEREEPEIKADALPAGSVPTAEEALDAVYRVLPIDRSLMEQIKVKRRADDVWVVTFTSDYGDFLYTIDAKTGEFLEREEPDIEAAKAAGTQVSLTAQQAFDAVFAVTPVGPKDRQDVRISKSGSDWVVTFIGPDGDYLYIVDSRTGEILDKDEPSVP